MTSSKTNQIFFAMTMVLTVSLIWAYSAFDRFFHYQAVSGGSSELIESQLAEARFEKNLAESRLQDLRLEVAKSLPQKIVASNEKLKNLNQVLREPAAIKIDLSGALFEKGKELFNQNKFNESLRVFMELREKFPFSIHSVESAFLAGESAYLDGDFEKFIEISDLMIEQYPSDDLTGFLMIRLGQMNEANGRYSEASEIYKAIEKSFKNSVLIHQAQSMIKSLESL